MSSEVQQGVIREKWDRSAVHSVGCTRQILIPCGLLMMSMFVNAVLPVVQIMALLIGGVSIAVIRNGSRQIQFPAGTLFWLGAR